MKNLFVVFFFMLAINLFAEDFEFLEFITSGTACPSGSTSVVLTPDGKSASIMFDQFNVQIPQYDGDNDNAEASEFDDTVSAKNDTGVNMKLCNLNFATTIPKNHQASHLEIQYDFRGYVYLDRGLRSTFKSILVQRQGLGVSDENKRQVLANNTYKATSVPYDKDFYFSTSSRISLNSTCGKAKQNKIKFSLKNVIGIKSTQNKKETVKSGMMNVDSADLVMHVKMVTMPCR